MTHRPLIVLLACALVVFAPTVSMAQAQDPPKAGGSAAAAEKPAVTVWKSPTCGCCGKWVEHMRLHGFEVTVLDMPDLTAIKTANGVTEAIRSCHTALVDGYVIEGHVPADVVQRLLKERPKATGLAVPGMPLGSPGMESPNPQAYDVLLFDRDGKTTVYEKR